MKLPKISLFTTACLVALTIVIYFGLTGANFILPSWGSVVIGIIVLVLFGALYFIFLLRKAKQEMRRKQGLDKADQAKTKDSSEKKEEKKEDDKKKDDKKATTERVVTTTVTRKSGWAAFWGFMKFLVAVGLILLLVFNFDTVKGFFGRFHPTKVKVLDGPPTIYTFYPNGEDQTVINYGPQGISTDRSYDVIGGILEGHDGLGRSLRLGDRPKDIDGPRYQRLTLHTVNTLLESGSNQVQLIFQDYHWEDKR